MAVYFAQAGENGPVKIGRARDPQVRLSVLQTGHHERIRVLRTIEGGSDVETWLHRQFKHCRLRGEWFRFDADMLSIAPPVAAARRWAAPPTSGSRQRFIRGVESFLAHSGVSERQFGIEAVSDHKFLNRLRSGAGIRLTVIERAERFIEGAPRNLTNKVNNNHLKV